MNWPDRGRRIRIVRWRAHWVVGVVALRPLRPRRAGGPSRYRPLSDEGCAPLCAARRLAARAVPPHRAISSQCLDTPFAVRQASRLLITCQPAGKVARAMSPRTRSPASDLPSGRLGRCILGMAVFVVFAPTVGPFAVGAPAPPRLALALLQAATNETNPEVRAQLAATARRLPARQGLPIAAALLARDGDLGDP